MNTSETADTPTMPRPHRGGTGSRQAETSGLTNRLRSLAHGSHKPQSTIVSPAGPGGGHRRADHGHHHFSARALLAPSLKRPDGEAL